MKETKVPYHGDPVLLHDLDSDRGTVDLAVDERNYKVPQFDIESDTHFWCVDIYVPDLKRPGHGHTIEDAWIHWDDAQKGFVFGRTQKELDEEAAANEGHPDKHDWEDARGDAILDEERGK